MPDQIRVDMSLLSGPTVRLRNLSDQVEIPIDKNGTTHHIRPYEFVIIPEASISDDILRRVRQGRLRIEPIEA